MDPGKLLFFDIESHRVVNWNEQTQLIKDAFLNHYYDSNTYATPEEHYNEVAGLHAEFSHVICISFGYRAANGDWMKMHFYGEDEVDILEKSRKIFDTFTSNGYRIAGHNIISCDIAYLVKRYIINKLPVPASINTYGCKPWEVDMLDTIDLWKFGDFKRVSLQMITACMGINCKSEEVNGGNLYLIDIKDMPWEELAKYCDEDVYSNALFAEQIFKYLPN